MRHALVARLLHGGGGAAAARILDLGSGQGDLIAKLRLEFPAAELLGFEMSASTASPNPAGKCRPRAFLRSIYSGRRPKLRPAPPGQPARCAPRCSSTSTIRRRSCAPHARIPRRGSPADCHGAGGRCRHLRPPDRTSHPLHARKRPTGARGCGLPDRAGLSPADFLFSISTEWSSSPAEKNWAAMSLREEPGLPIFWRMRDDGLVPRSVPVPPRRTSRSAGRSSLSRSRPGEADTLRQKGPGRAPMNAPRLASRTRASVAPRGGEVRRPRPDFPRDRPVLRVDRFPRRRIPSRTTARSGDYIQPA